MRKGKSVLALAASLAFGFSSAAQAVVDCAGDITSLSLQLGAEGTIVLSLSGGPSHTYLCDIDGAGRNGVSPAVCRAMYASLMAAKVSAKKVYIRFYDYNTCSAVPEWGDAGTLGWTILFLE